MGQSVGTPACAFTSLHLCETEEGPSGAMVFPQRCGGGTSRCSTSCSSQSAFGIFKSYSLDPTSACSFPCTGWFSTALKAVHRNSGETRVVRVVSKRRCDSERMARELEVLRSLNHPNLARVCEVTEDSKYTCIFLENLPGTDLLSAVVNTTAVGRSSSETVTARLLRQLLLGLQQLHTAGVVHEDVHPRNILVAEGLPGQDLRLKLIDYGLAFKYGKTAVPHPLVQNFHCVAPEQVTESPRHTGSFLADPACDIWAVGAIAFFLMSGRWPFEAETPDLLRKKIRISFWSFEPSEAWINVSPSAKSFVKDLLSVSTSQRPNAGQALTNNWFLQATVPETKAALRRPTGSPPSSTQARRRLCLLAARFAVQRSVVDALALTLSAARLEDLRRHFTAMAAASAKAAAAAAAAPPPMVPVAGNRPGDADAGGGGGNAADIAPVGDGSGGKIHGSVIGPGTKGIPRCGSRGESLLTMTAVRQALVQAGVNLPGRLLSSMLVLDAESPEESLVNGGEIVDVACDRRRSLEEVLLWNAWSASAPEGRRDGPTVRIRRDELMKVFQLGGPILLSIGAELTKAAGAFSGIADTGLLPEMVNLDEFIAWLQLVRRRPTGGTNGGGSGRGGNCGANMGVSAAWIRSSAAVVVKDLAVRLPPPPDPM